MGAGAVLMRNEGIIKSLAGGRVGPRRRDRLGRGRLRANARIDALYLNTQNVNGFARSLTLLATGEPGLPFWHDEPRRILPAASTNYASFAFHLSTRFRLSLPRGSQLPIMT